MQRRFSQLITLKENIFFIPPPSTLSKKNLFWPDLFRFTDSNFVFFFFFQETKLQKERLPIAPSVVLEEFFTDIYTVLQRQPGNKTKKRFQFQAEFDDVKNLINFKKCIGNFRHWQRFRFSVFASRGLQGQNKIRSYVLCRYSFICFQIESEYLLKFQKEIN